MSKPSRIVELSARIAANTTKVDDYLAAHNLPTPSFDVDAPLQSLVPGTEPDIAAARQAVIHDTLELHQLMLGPREHLFSYYPTHLSSQQVIVRHGLARLVPIDGEVTFAELAAAAGLGETHVRKLIRHAISQRIFKEPRPGFVAHSANSRLLAENSDVADWVGWCADESWLSAYHTSEAITRWPASEEPTETGFCIANKTNLPMYDVLAANPARAARFAAGMRLYAARPDLHVSHIVNAWTWGELPPDATVVDVGGSHGEIAITLARAYPSLNLIVQDISEQTIREADARKPTDVGDRVRFMKHDFFNEQPVVGADVYLYRGCFHNWSDKYAVRMVQALIPALKPGTHLIINDYVVPRADELSPGLAPAIRTADLQMMTLFNAGDRELTEWENLFTKASPGFEFKGGKSFPGSAIWTLVAVWKGV
ncbi:S-adenosyl-L-methionine-dependent methyltransferase [Hypoxylon trugodes]|uniref:S-adenosyl-L-methionine-dependent methyltransferase n=1 Tax=Hypoxylon trugodes TaxID=326681 RepID=UPI002194A777|nr:S-adenosyl-L-methionine-dependent methyltransferase [Hypoxylon trugodes]KAI1390514.1 S-adenosyl-L-methionine-dependent methyltransferase [Hypoxylon trugodes]